MIDKQELRSLVMAAIKEGLEPGYRWALNIDPAAILRALDELEACKADAERWRCVRNAVPMQSPYAVWREGSHVVLGQDADQTVDNFLSSCKAAKSE